MALAVQRYYIPDDIPPGQMAGKIIKAVYTDTRNNIFPSDSPYGRDWSESISYLGRKRNNSNSDVIMQGERVLLPLEHPLEGRNNPHPSKPFMNWKVPSRYGDSRPTTREIQLREHIETIHDPKRANSRQHEVTHTTHHAPPQGKFQPIRSEQQEHMAEVMKREEAIQKSLEAKVATLPRMSLSANPAAKPLLPRTYSAAQRWLTKNPGQEKLAKQVLRQCGRTEVDHVLEHTLEPNAQKAVSEWLKTATERDRKAALGFFSTLAGQRFLGGPSGTHPASNIEGDNDARLRIVLRTLQKNKGQAPPQQDISHHTIDDSIKSLMKAVRMKHLRLHSPNTRLRHREYQTWHHMPVYNYNGRIDNTLAMYTKPNAPIPKDFRIHPEWDS